MHTLQKKVYDNIVRCGDVGTTDDAAEQKLDMKHTTYTARRGELVKMGLVKDSGERAKTRSGKNAVRWVAVDPGNETELVAQAKQREKEKLKAAPKTLVRPSQIPMIGKDVGVTLRAVQERMVERLKSGDEIKCPCCATLLRGG
tara:strand:- start:116 stop:547 length:432 start_codon:yes stop_codon:yes gene_type:complete